MPARSRLRISSTAHAARRFPEVLDVHLAAQLLTVSADTVYDLFQRGDVPGRKVGRKWLTTTTAVLKWLAPSTTPHTTAAQDAALARAIAHGDTAVLVDAVQTGKARLGTQGKPPSREDASSSEACHSIHGLHPGVGHWGPRRSARPYHVLAWHGQERPRSWDGPLSGLRGGRRGAGASLHPTSRDTSREVSAQKTAPLQSSRPAA